MPGYSKKSQLHKRTNKDWGEWVLNNSDRIKGDSEKDLEQIRQDLKKKNKYNARQKTYKGRTYHSELECRYAVELDIKKMIGEVVDWIPQHKFSLDVNGFHITNYFIDFKVILPDGMVEYVEVKGFETDTWFIKFQLTQALFFDLTEPGSRLILVKKIGYPKIIKTHFKTAA